MVLLNSSTVMLTGGLHNYTFSADTYLLNMKSNEWVKGPSFKTARCCQGCGRIRKNLNSEKFDVIAVGGWNGVFLKSVEIYDHTISEWRAGIKSLRFYSHNYRKNDSLFIAFTREITAV